jgi:pimeloyl-ACP methyl ester carboxylesterase
MRFFLTVASLFVLISGAAATAHNAKPSLPVHYGTTEVEGFKVFYREAGNLSAPAIVLLHGFPSSSYQYRDLIPLLSAKYHVIAPDYIGFGNSDTPAPDKFDYSFEHESLVTERFLELHEIKKFVFFMHDYGGPIGMRIAIRHPEKIQALIFQNANVYEEGLEPRFFLKKPLWENRNSATELPVLRNMEIQSTMYQHSYGAKTPELVSPDSWSMDQYFLDRPGNKLIQLELQYDYRNNLIEYPHWQALLRDRQFPTLVVWGRNDPIFGAQGAEAFRKDLPNAEIHLLDTGHFPLEEYSIQTADYVNGFLGNIFGAGRK